MDKLKLTPAQRQMLRDHEDLKLGQALCHTSGLGSRKTWTKLYDMGLLKGGRLTDAGRNALGVK